MAVNKVIFGDETLIDLTDDTVSPEDVIEGATFHNSSGEKVEGVLRVADAQAVLHEAKEYTDSSFETTKNDLQSSVNGHNTAEDAHNDIRLLIRDLTTKLTNFLDVDDTTVDELSEVLELINNNKGTLESLTTSKINVSAIVDNLTTSDPSKVLSAKQGVAIKALIDALQGAVDNKLDEVTSEDITLALGYTPANPSKYLPLAGGTLTGAITLPNNTALKSKDQNGTEQEVLRANASKQIIIGANGAWDLIVLYHAMAPATSVVDALDIGAVGRRWRNLYLSGSISDGTNSVKVVDIAKKSDIPTVPTQLSELTGDATHRTVTDAEKETWNAKSNFDGNYNNLSNKPSIPSATETWTFTLEDGSTVNKVVYVG